jgi:hypothetical protein
MTDKKNNGLIVNLFTTNGFQGFQQQSTSELQPITPATNVKNFH